MRAKVRGGGRGRGLQCGGLGRGGGTWDLPMDAAYEVQVVQPDDVAEAGSEAGSEEGRFVRSPSAGRFAASC
jgi:hypothetical protein